MARTPTFPDSQQAQIIRARQRDLYHVASLTDQTQNVLRTWLGTRWLAKWDKEVNLFTHLLYYGLTIGRATQTLGEEYTDIWQYSIFSNRAPLSISLRAILILLPTLPRYTLSKISASNSLSERFPRIWSILKRIPIAIETLTEINLATFYLTGTYYDLSKRIVGIRYLSIIPENPNNRPPSYALLGILIGVRLLHRCMTYMQSLQQSQTTVKAPRIRETFLDNRPISSLLESTDPVECSAEKDENTMLDVRAIAGDQRAGRNCTLCLEERTNSCSTECGHLFCWSCIVGWGREKAECPLCRQGLHLERLLPIYNL